MKHALIRRRAVFASMAFLGSLFLSVLTITATEITVVRSPAQSLPEIMTEEERQPRVPISLQLGSSDGSLGEFRPTQDVTIDSSNAFWSGKPAVLDIDTGTGEILGGVFEFTNVVIPEGVTVRFNGFGYVMINAAADIIIDGTIEGSGGNGSNGTNGRSGINVPGGDGGNGGDGGMATPPPPPGGSSSQGGRGLGGGGGGGQPTGRRGQRGDGATNSPGNPTIVRGSFRRPTGGGSAGGGNGTPGAKGEGTWIDGYYAPGPAFGSMAIGSNPRPSGGGSGASGGIGVRVLDKDTGDILGQGTGGGGGGGGGAGGTLLLQTAENITITGTIRVNGGNGGNGGDGAPNSLPAPGAEGGDGGGGGGGGAGGFILLRGRIITVSGRLEARGGSGGLGGRAGSLKGESYAGSPGGAGGGGRIAAIASQSISGVTSSPGAPASGRDRPGEPTIFAAVISLTQTPKPYLPKNGNTVSYRAEVSSALAGATFRFELKKVSAFLGDAMNHYINDDPSDPLNTAPDYFFAPQAGFNPPSDDELTIQTASEVTSINVTVSSRDYGGIAEIHATAIFDGLEVPAGVLGTSDLFARIPLDNNRNGLPDAGWDADTGRHIDDSDLTASGDIDNIPVGNGTLGDNLTNFEEYRGFFIQGQHRRLDPFKKDLFIKSQFDGSVESVFNQGIGFAANLPLTVHQLRFDSYELNENGVVNYNFTNSGEGGDIPGHADQAGLLILVGGDGNPTEYGSVEAPGIPNSVGVIEVFANRLRMHSPPVIDRFEVEVLDPFDDGALRYLIAHQVGHAVGMSHYPFDPFDPMLSNMVTAYLLRTADLGDPRWNDIPDSYSAEDIGQIRLK